MLTAACGAQKILFTELQGGGSSRFWSIFHPPSSECIAELGSLDRASSFNRRLDSLHWALYVRTLLSDQVKHVVLRPAFVKSFCCDPRATGHPNTAGTIQSTTTLSSTWILLGRNFQHSPSRIPARVSLTCLAVSDYPFHFLLSGCMPADSSLVNVPNQLLNISEASITWSSNQKVWSMPQGPQSVNFSSSLPCKPSARCQPSYYLWRMPQCFHAVYWHWSASSIAFEPSFNLKLESLLRCPR
jgi:hypothetical protein